MGTDISIGDVSSEKVGIFLAGRGPLTASWHVRHNALRGFYRYAVSRGLIDRSPLPDVIPKRSAAFQPYIYSSAELKRILNSIESCRRRRSDIDAPLLRCLFLLMYGAALRTSELLSLRFSDVDLANCILTIRDTKFFKTRLVPIGTKTAQLLVEYLKLRDDPDLLRRRDEPFFLDRNGTESSSSSSKERSS
jgi:site-specific recombinase XerD